MNPGTVPSRKSPSSTLARSLFPLVNVLGGVIGIFAFAMLIPLGVATYTRDAGEEAYHLAFLVTFGVGAGLWLSTRRFRRELQPRDGFLLVFLVWTLLPAFATLPLLLHLPGLSLTDAYFEAMSGLTTTGATTLTGLSELPLSINVWRHVLQWLGGLGIVVLAVAILPLLGVGGSQVFRAEMAGPMKGTKLTPRIADTAKLLYGVYVLLSLTCMIAYRAAGMSWADAFMHMCSTVSIGGFSPYDGSIGHFDSQAIEIVAIVFMLLSGFNFTLHYFALRRLAPSVYWRDPEARSYVGAMLTVVAVCAIVLLVSGTYGSGAETLRHAVFNVVSIATTTGYASVDYAQWPPFVPLLMLLFACFCACAGSTGGGVKMIRALVLLKQARRELVRLLHPQVVSPVIVGRQQISNELIFAILAFMLIYGLSLLAPAFLLMLGGADIVTAFSAAVACINNIGPGLGAIGPSGNYAGFSDFQTWVCTFAMLIGRLELMSVLVLFTPAFWRK